MSFAARCRTAAGVAAAIPACAPTVRLARPHALLGEALFRSPWVVAHTGGNNPGQLAWEERHYDDVERRNPLGLRSFHTARPKAAGVRRIVALGDSFTHGDAVARTEDLWPYVLERTLAPKMEVINLGRGGLTTVNEAELLETMGWRFQPDLVLVQFTLNDPLPSGPGMQHHNEGWIFPTVSLIPRFHPWLNRHSYFYSFLNQRFWALQMLFFFPKGYAALYDDDLPAWKECRSALARMAASARSHGVPMMVVLSERGYPYLEVHEKIREATAAVDLPLLDLRPVFAARDPHGRAWWALPSDWHPSVEGHRIAGEAVAAEIVTRGLLP
ncbi:MAG TPA: SGNH/GDSL hydrolase family protein [Candidatus Polarisedimenticolaceae bacterium]|nr:SGNH/GDSL hydrolase family protein [Candidatus Polarisedimenticolaceae bacterium]